MCSRCIFEGQRQTSRDPAAVLSFLLAVNLPGYSYSIIDGVPSAQECPTDSFGPDLKKQRACVPCPTGFTTGNKTRQMRPPACGKCWMATASDCHSCAQCLALNCMFYLQYKALWGSSYHAHTFKMEI